MFNKTLRQLLLFHMFYYSEVLEPIEIKSLLKVSNRTIARDLHELQRAGLINVVFSKKEKGYIHQDNRYPCAKQPLVFSENKANNRHLEKLIRLATIMIELAGHTEISYYDCSPKEQETCSSWYKKKFPNVSKRTMQRDFQELSKIGYEISYDYFERLYTVTFPQSLEAIENCLRYKYKDRE
ncbi:transcriptional regulator [Clostridium aceticum]|uniref:Transcriptional regulator n=1 Tax=Clostridium aceticum TaxID=84022 RepID=A0A0D8I5C5_9CLOT|nr:HTH domain-containing protein [Clostridium aceticum]AKL94573.1 transcriptional regulator [Clostridium aceticum]KJF25438.1 hypothetical protein TZ02_18695 [Clostridium aceticum]